MEFLSHLWLPLILASAACWFWSFLSWAVLPLHKNDWKTLPSEDAFGGAVRPLNIPPGVYGFPHCEGHGQQKDPAFQEKWKKGPVGYISVWNPNPSMGGNMVLSLAIYLIVSLLIAYAGYNALPHAPRMKAFQIAGTMGILAYSFAFLPNMIWFQGEKKAMLTALFDGIVQGLLTGLLFALFWPA